METIQRRMEPAPFTAVKFEDAFWKPRMETNREVTIAHIYAQCEQTGRISAFDLDFEREVPTPIVHIFQDSDIAKWIEAAAYSLATHPDAALEARVDAVIEKIAAAQQKDGYLNTHFTVVQPHMRLRNLRDWHELYCAGHLIEAAAAYVEATGKRALLDVVCRYVDLLADTFGPGPGQKRGYCGHPEIELALLSLHRVTGDARHLELASYFVDERGRQPHYFDQEARERGEDPAAYRFKTYEYCQAHIPLRDQQKVVGHAVRAMYLLSAASDLSAAKNDAPLWQACLRLWDNLVSRRMYLTGAIGPSGHNEGFTEDYDLPDESAYAETCATIGMMQWNLRMLQISGESRFADEVERGLYNGFLSSVSLAGDSFFYENPLASRGGHHRAHWFDCPCCPPNIARTLASLGRYFYSSGPRALWVHLYAQGSVELPLAAGGVHVRQVTGYPWDGGVRLELTLAEAQNFSLHLRIPGWCRHWVAEINGVAVEAGGLEHGYLRLERQWQSGDVVTLRMDMPVEALWANPAVRYLEGRMALRRGPLVYCLEGVDQAGIILDRLSVSAQDVADGKFSPVQHPGLPGGVLALRGPASLVSEAGWQNQLYRSQKPQEEETHIVAVPYFAWDNRADGGEMRVWLREK